MRGVVVFASLLVMSSCFAGCLAKIAEEHQQNQENTSDDDRKEITGKFNVNEVFIDSNTEGSSDNNSSSSEVKVDSILVIARMASGSMDVTVSEIYHYITCSRGEVGNEQALVVSGAVADSAPSELDDIPLTGESELTAGQSFQFTVQLGDCAAAVGDDLQMRMTLEGGGETLVDLEVDSTEVGRSVA